MGPAFLCLVALGWSQVGAVAADSFEPDDTAAQARWIATDGSRQTHEIQPASDVDYVRFSATAGTEYVIQTFSTSSSDVRDTVITLYGSDGATFIAEDDDGGTDYCSRLEHIASASGTLYVRVRSYSASYTGGYRISVDATQSATISGTVTRAGAPAEGVTIWVRPAQQTGFDRPAAVTTTDARGRYAVGVEAGTYVVSAHLAGTVASPAEQYVSVPGGSHSAFSLSPAPPAGADGVQTCRALLIGVADYAGTINDLSYCDDDALDFGAALTEGSNWRAENIAVLINESATRDAIRSGLERLATLSDADDLCVFLFSGHGSHGRDIAPIDEANGQDEFLVTYHATTDVRDDELGEWIESLPTPNFMGVIAACHSGGMIKSAQTRAGMRVKGLGATQPAGVSDGFAEDLRRAMARRRQMSPLDLDDNGFGVVITAADYDETCQESNALQHDILVYYLLEGMAGPADSDGDSAISAEELYDYAAPRATDYNSGQHAQIYDAAPGIPLDFLDHGQQQRAVTITEGPSGSPATVASNGEVQCSVSARESLGGAIDYEWAATTGEFSDTSIPEPIWTAPANDAGEEIVATLSVTARSADDPTVSDSGSFQVTVLAGQQGDVHITDGPTAEPAVTAAGDTVQCSVTAADGNGNELTYRWRARDSDGTLVGGFDDASTSEPGWTVPVGATGEYTLSVTVNSSTTSANADSGAVEVTVATRLEHEFAAGVQMVALPGAGPGQTIGQALGASAVASWDPGVGDYSSDDPAAVAGAGIWARFDAPTHAVVLCQPCTETTFSWELSSGWNIISSPWGSPVQMSSLSSTPAAAVAPLAWTYADATYQVLSGLALAGSDSDALQPWHSYWVYASEDCTVTLAGNLAPTEADALVTTGANGWLLRLMARSASGADAAGLCGVAETALTVPDLPAARGGPNLSLEDTTGGSLLTVDLRDKEADCYTWPLQVSAAPGEEVTVRAVDLSLLPRGLRVILEDRDTGAATSLRTGAGYRFTASDAPRRLMLRVERSDATLALSGVTARQAARGAAVTFTLSTPAEIAAEVLNIAGCPVRHLVSGRQGTAGVQMLTWDLRSDAGSPVPAGRYIVRVTAQSDEGETVRAIAPVSIQR